MKKTILALTAAIAFSGAAFAEAGNSDNPMYLTQRSAVDFSGSASMSDAPVSSNAQAGTYIGSQQREGGDGM